MNNWNCSGTEKFDQLPFNDYRIRFVFFCIIIVLALSMKMAIAGKVLEVGSELDYAPFATVNEDGEADGFSVDLFKSVAQVMGYQVHFRIGPWQDVRRALEKGEIDALPLVSYSDERDKVFDFTNPHTASYATVFTCRGDDSFASEDELHKKAFHNKKIIVMQSDATHDHLLEYGVKAAHSVSLPGFLGQKA
jgi:ABC-type amino acid transport substrate-binding protein